MAGTLYLPHNKLHRLHQLLEQWQNLKTTPSKRELLSLVGVLSHAATVVPPGRAFTRNLIQAAAGVKRLNRPVRLNIQCRADLIWWQAFAHRWNSRKVWPSTRTHITCFTNASGSWGCVAVLASYQFPRWYQLEWPASWSSQHIAAKEMVPAASIWGCCWAQKLLLVHSDSIATMAAITAGSSADPVMAHLCGCLFFISAKWRFEMSATHIADQSNNVADALSKMIFHIFSVPTSCQPPPHLNSSLPAGLGS